MKLIKNANGETQLKISKTEWEKLGEESGWTKRAGSVQDLEALYKELYSSQTSLYDVIAKLTSLMKSPKGQEWSKELNQAFYTIATVSRDMEATIRKNSPQSTENTVGIPNKNAPQQQNTMPPQQGTNKNV